MTNLNQKLIEASTTQGRSQDFSKGGGGGVTRCQNEVTHQIFMSFLPPVVGCLLKTWLTKGGSRAPQDPPWLRPCHIVPVPYRVAEIRF